jgi:glycosyltransferase involved in cell wall biosynthesis
VLFNALQAGNRSGTGVYSAQLARWLPQIDSACEVDVLWPQDEPLPDIPDSIRDQYTLTHSGGALSRIFQEHSSAARETHADLVHYPCNVIGLRERTPAVVTVHDLTFLEEPAWYRWERAAYNRWGVSNSVRRAKRVIAVSEATADALVNRLNVDRNRIDVVYNGVDERFMPAEDETKKEVRKKYELPTNFFLFVGTLEPRKNLVRVINAWSRIAGEIEQDLVLAGREGWKAESIFEAARASAHSARIRFVGFVDHGDLPRLMGTADALVYPSLAEGFGIPVAEAMACGTPVITSNVSSLPEVAGDAGILVDPVDETAIADAMQRLAGDAAIRSDHSARGIERAQKFSWRKSAEQTMETYRKALS